MGKINILSPILSNMIAAGEVVERPSNIVKELVENSIDAKSKNIAIYCLNGGITEIKVIDDGIGMDSEDINACFYAHATSKIKDEYDLARISTLGFRGEAIASIASVSKTTILSKQKDSIGNEVTYRFGKKINEDVASIKDGTTVIVNDLFINTPVRLKYLKSPEKELSSIAYLIDKLALTHTDIAFSLYNDEKLLFSSNGNGDIYNLIGSIYGLEAAKKTVEVPFNEKGYSGKFYYVKPEIYRSNKLHLTYIVNDRYIRNFAINDAISEAFKEYLPINKYPILILYLNIDPLLIDVNVHPKKAEIRISDENGICQRFVEILRDSLHKTNHIHEKVKERETIKIDYSQILNTSFSQVSTLKDDVSLFEEVPSVKDETIYIKDVENVKENKQPIIKTTSVNLDLDIIGFFRDTYILASKSDGLYIIDQHAAAERIKYEYYLNQMKTPSKLRSELIVPITIELSKDEMIYALTNQNEFLDLGFLVEQFTNNTIIIREVPLWAANKDINEIIISLINEMINDKKIDLMKYRDKICKQISCKASIRANDKISFLEARKLLEQLFTCENPYHCPHGRPTIIKFSDDEIKRMFERVQK